jgi:hypothetical protein
MIAPAKAGKFTLYRAERQGFAAERVVAQKIQDIGKTCDQHWQNLWQGNLRPHHNSPLRS